MIKAPITLQELRRKIYATAKAEKTKRFWGLYVHVHKLETLHEAYKMAKANNGAPGIDGVTFEAIEAAGVEGFLRPIQKELERRDYRPMRCRRKEIPKEGGKVRILSIPSIRDRVVQGALRLILEPIFEADFQPGSFGYRPKRSAHQAVEGVSEAIVRRKRHVIDIDLRAFFDSVRHHILLKKVAERVNDDDVMHLLKMMLKATGEKGVPQGGVISPLLSNIYLNEVDRMLERAKEVTRQGEWTYIEYARYADDLVILVSSEPRWDWLLKKAEQRLREELAKLEVELNEEKSRIVDLEKGESFGFLGFEFRLARSRSGKWYPNRAPRMKKRTAMLRELKRVFRRYKSQPVQKVIAEINPKLKGWVDYFAIGHSSRCFSYLRLWVEKRVRRHIRYAQKRGGYGWKKWSTARLYAWLGLFNNYRVTWNKPRQKALAICRAT